MSNTIIVKSAPSESVPMKIVNMDDKVQAKAYLSRPPEDTHSAKELESVHRAIRFTQMFKHEESMSKMDQEELIARPLPRMPKSK